MHRFFEPPRGTRFTALVMFVFGISLSHTVSAQHGHTHNEATMPGLRGENASAEESAEIALLFRRFNTLSREVENLPNGIRTTTNSSDAGVKEVLVSHVVGMLNRVEQLDDPRIFIQSPTLDVFFLHGKEIATTVETTEDGIIVEQTSENPMVVTALQTHAEEVTAMVDRGMAAVHEMMQKQGRGH